MRPARHRPPIWCHLALAALAAPWVAPGCGSGEAASAAGAPALARHQETGRDQSARLLEAIDGQAWVLPPPRGDAPRRASHAAPHEPVSDLAKESYYVEAAIDPLGARMGVVGMMPAGHAGTAAFEQGVIPRIVHRIYFPGMGNHGLAGELDAAWTEYGRQQGFAVRRWTEADEGELAAMMPVANAALMRRYLREGPSIGASHLARYSVLERFGGIFIDAWVRPPRLGAEEETPLALEDLMPSRGLVVMSAWDPHATARRRAGLTLTDKVIAGPAGAAAFAKCVDLAVFNHLTFSGGGWPVLPAYTTGKLFFDRVIQHVARGFTLLPASTLASVGMIDRASEQGPETMQARGYETVGRVGGLTALMDARPPTMAELAELAVEGEPHYFDAPVPQAVHQIWLGDIARLATTCRGQPHARTRAWRSWAEGRGWRYRLWTDDDLPELAALGGEDLAARMRAYRRVGDFRGAADVARYLILYHHGGLYADVDISAPGSFGRPDAIDAAWPARGLVVSGEADFHFGNIGMYAGNSFLLSSPRHPMLAWVLRSLPANDDSWRRSGRGHDPVYVSGPGFLSSILGGPLTVVSNQHHIDFGVDGLPDDEIDVDDPRMRGEWPRNLAVGE